MEELLSKVSELVDKSTKIPEDIKPIVKAICRGYIRETNGMIPISGIINVCETTFKEIDPNDKDFSGEDRILGSTDTTYDSDGKVIHGMSYIHYSNYVKLITILTHELGHVITEHSIYGLQDDKCPIVKRTGDFYLQCEFKDGVQYTRGMYGFRVTDGFLESTSSKIFLSEEFRRELLEAGYDLEDYEYKDERLFPSRVYDEYRACFELFDYIMDGALTEFCCKEFTSNEEIINYINENKLSVLFGYIDKSNNALWSLKKFEGREWSEEFNTLLQTYLNEKDSVINLAYALLGVKGKSEDDRFKELLSTYKSCLSKQKELPIPENILRDSMKLE